ncbi:MAG: SDR family oxidoreductase [Chlamydia sp.]
MKSRWSYGKPEEVAKGVQFMLSKESDFINGANILLDGGLTESYQ